MARFHSLEVTDVRNETRDAVVLTLKPRKDECALFDFTQGQYLTSAASSTASNCAALIRFVRARTKAC